MRKIYNKIISEQVISSEEELSTNNKDVWYPKLELSFIPINSGEHIINWYTEYKMSKINKETIIQVNQDDTILAESILLSHESNKYFNNNGFAIIDLTKNQSYTLILKFKLLSSQTTFYIRRARLFIRRLL